MRNRISICGDKYSRKSLMMARTSSYAKNDEDTYSPILYSWYHVMH